MAQYKTTLGRGVLALFAGALTGGAISTGAFAVSRLTSDHPVVAEAYWLLGRGFWAGVSHLTTLALFASGIWLVALMLFGATPWFILEQRRKRDPRTAALAGFAIATLAMLVMSSCVAVTRGRGSDIKSDAEWLVVDGETTASGWVDLFVTSVAYGAAGALVAIVVWRVAYRRVEEPTDG